MYFHNKRYFLYVRTRLLITHINFFISSSYEDSLNSEAQRKTQETSFSQKSLSSSKNLQQRRSRNRSLSDGAGLLQRSGAVSAFPPRSHINPPYLISGHTPVRRPNDRLFLS